MIANTKLGLQIDCRRSECSLTYASLFLEAQSLNQLNVVCPIAHALRVPIPPLVAAKCWSVQLIGCRCLARNVILNRQHYRKKQAVHCLTKGRVAANAAWPFCSPAGAGSANAA